MHRNLNHWVTFAALADAGSFAGAARRLGLPTSTVSEHVAALERNLGLQLVIRTTRQNRLTEAGRHLALGAARMVETVAETLAEVERTLDRPEGKLRVSLPFAFAAEIVGPAVGRFAALYPGIRLELLVSNDVEDLISGSFDLAVRIGALQDSGLIRRSLGAMPQDLVATTAYLERRGRPQSLADLDRHCIVGLRPTLTLAVSGPGGLETTMLDAQVCVNDPKTAAAIIHGGAGLGILPRFLARSGLEDGSLEIVLPAYRHPAVEMSIVYHGPAGANPRTDLFATFLQAELRRPGRRTSG